MSINNDAGALASALSHEPRCGCEQRYERPFCSTPKACGALARLAEGTDSKRYQPMPGDLVEVRSDFLVKHYDAHGVRLGKVDKTAGGDAWWVQLPGYAKTIRFEAGELTLVRRG